MQVKKRISLTEIAGRRAAKGKIQSVSSATRTQFKARNAIDIDAGGTDWRELDLSDTDFSKANLQGASFVGAVLRNARFWDADLSDCDFSRCIGILPEQLAGAVLTRATLPDSIEKWQDLENVRGISESAAKVFVTMLAALAFVVLTLAACSDYNILLNTQGVKLPLIGVEIPVVLFFLAAPILLLTLYLYLHIYLLRLWEAMSRLPAIFPDGRRLDEVTSPWLLNDLGRSLLPKLKNGLPPLSRIQNGLGRLLGWWIVPACIWLLWAFGLRAEDDTITELQVISLSISVAAAVGFSRLLVETFSARRNGVAEITAKLQHNILRRCGVVAIVCVAILWCWSYGIATSQMMPECFLNPDLKNAKGATWFAKGIVAIQRIMPHANPGGNFCQRWGPHALLGSHITPFAIVPGIELSKRPPQWTGDFEKASIEIPLVQGGRFVGRRLRHIWAWQAFLVNVDLTGADIRGAHFELSDFRGATLMDMSAVDSIFTNSIFCDQGKFRTGVNGEPDVHVPNVQRTAFSRSIFTRSWMRGFRAYNCAFDYAHIDQVDASTSTWTDCSFKGADFSYSSFKNARFMSYCDLRYVNGAGTDFSNANFGHAALAHAKFDGATLDGCDFSNANVEVAQLLAAKSLKGVKVNPSIEPLIRGKSTP